MRFSSNRRFDGVRRDCCIAAMIASLVLPLSSTAWAQSTRTRGSLPTDVGTRIERADAAPGLSPTGRIPNRLQTRIDSRITHDVDAQGNAARRNALRSFQQAVRTQADTTAATRVP